MESFAFIIPLLYLLFVLGLCAFLLMRGVTHAFIACFTVGALLELIPQLGYLVLRSMPGGFAANGGYYKFFMVFGAFGTIAFAIGFFLLAQFLLAPKPAA